MSTDLEEGIYVSKDCPVCGMATAFYLRPDDLARWNDGELIQNVWPNMSVDEREIMISGTHAHCWDQLFGEEE